MLCGTDFETGDVLVGTEASGRQGEGEPHAIIENLAVDLLVIGFMGVR